MCWCQVILATKNKPPTQISERVRKQRSWIQGSQKPLGTGSFHLHYWANLSIVSSLAAHWRNIHSPDTAVRVLHQIQTRQPRGTVGAGIPFIRWAGSSAHTIHRCQTVPAQTSHRQEQCCHHGWVTLTPGPSPHRAITQRDTDKYTLPGYCWKPGSVCSVHTPRNLCQSQQEAENECGKTLFPRLAHLSIAPFLNFVLLWNVVYSF